MKSNEMNFKPEVIIISHDDEGDKSKVTLTLDKSLIDKIEILGFARDIEMKRIELKYLQKRDESLNIVKKDEVNKEEAIKNEITKNNINRSKFINNIVNSVLDSDLPIYNINGMDYNSQKLYAITGNALKFSFMNQYPFIKNECNKIVNEVIKELDELEFNDFDDIHQNVINIIDEEMTSNVNEYIIKFFEESTIPVIKAFDNSYDGQVVIYEDIVDKIVNDIKRFIKNKKQ